MNVSMVELKCPICHSAKVKGFKVCDKQGRWWSKCISGKDHGLLVTEEGREVEWPEYPYFTQDGLCEAIVDDKPLLVKIARQEYK